MKERALAVLIVVAACGGDVESVPAPPSGIRVVTEQFVTPLDTMDNIDSPAVYHGPRGEHWVLATAKTTHQLVVYDAVTGAVVRRVGGPGREAGQLNRPNGVAVLDDSIALVVERDNARVQAFRLPGFEPLGSFGESVLRLPYGVATIGHADGSYSVYVTDNYETDAGEVPPDRELGERVKLFAVTFGGGIVSAKHVKSFGDTVGDGVIRIVESIAVDNDAGILLIAEELETDSHIKVYDLEGRFTGTTFGRGFFPQQAEGIALFKCGDSTGYWIATDQGDSTNTFHLFDRRTFKHMTSFTGVVTRRTDGIALTQREFGPYTHGALFASHLDAGLGGFRLDYGCDGAVREGGS